MWYMLSLLIMTNDYRKIVENGTVNKIVNIPTRVFLEKLIIP